MGLLGNIRGLAENPIIYVLLSVILLSIISAAVGWGIEHDSVNLMAMARSMATFELPVMGGSHLLPSNDAHYSLHLLFIVSIWKMMGGEGFASLYTSFAFTGILGTGLFAISLYVFCLRLHRDRWFASSAVVIALLAWGPLQGLWAGNYSLAGITISGVLPQTFGFVSTLWSMTLLLDIVQGAGSEKVDEAGLGGWDYRSVAILSALVALTGLIHLLSMVFLALGFFAIISAYAIPVRRILLLASSWIPCALALLIWPYYSLSSTFGTEIGGTDTSVLPLAIYGLSLFLAFFLARWAAGRLDLFSDVFSRLRAESIFVLLSAGFLGLTLVLKGTARSSPHDPLYIGVVVLGFASFLRQPTRNRFFLSLWAAAGLGGYLLGQLGEEAGMLLPYFERFLFFGMLPLHVLLTDYLTQLFSGQARRIRLVVGVMLPVALCLWNIYVFSYFPGLVPYIGPEVESLAEAIPPGSIIVSDPMTSRILAGRYGFTVVNSITNEELLEERNGVVSDFFNASTDPARLQFHAEKFGADLLAMPTTVYRESRGLDPEEIGPILDKYQYEFTELFRNKGYRLYALLKNPSTR
jgi:hypothetical protein